MSRPDSTIEVQTSTSASPRRNSSIVLLELRPRPSGRARPTRARPGTSARMRSAVSSIVSTRLCRKNAWPSRGQLALDRLRDQLLVVLADVGLDRAAALGRRLDHRDVAQAGERHLQRARDRRGRQRQHVDLQLELAQQLLLLDAEALLLVDDQQAEVLRAHVAREQPVRADQDVDLAALEGRRRVARLLRRAEARDHVDRERVVAQALAERAEVLLGEHRGRHQEHHLLAVLGGLERGAQRDLGLAVADVAADQAVHRARLLHVGAHGLDRLELVGRLAVREGALELELPLASRAGRRGRRGACARRRA